MNARVLLAEDHKIVREGIKKMLNDTPGLSVVAEVEDGRKAVETARRLRPDIVVMDITMPNLNGIDATREIVAAVSDARVIALSVHTEKQYVRAMLEAGAYGYMLKQCAFEELIGAINAVMRNETYLSPGVAQVLVADYLMGASDRSSGTTAFNTLTCREREVLQLVAEGYITKEIASRLCVCERTVETHRQRIMNKLNLHSVASITKYAIREGLTSVAY